ncbi:MAG: PQQ-dependent sugar dehydrogenase [Phycisphaerales bacterium]
MSFKVTQFCLLGTFFCPSVSRAYTVERLTLPGNPTGGVNVDSSLHLPVDIDIAPGVSDSYFVSQLGAYNWATADIDPLTDRLGKIVRVDRATGVVDYANPFLVIEDTSLVEGHPHVPQVGLFSTVFHPDFQINGKLYVAVAADFEADPPTLPGDPRVPVFNLAIREYVADPGNLAAGATFSKTIINIVEPRYDHDGGWLGFNPKEVEQGKRYLYITVGDGGDQHDPYNNGQNIESPLGSILRVDLDGDAFPADDTRNYAIPADNPFVGAAGMDEIFAYGFRNPWQASFDRATGDFYIGDVGQYNWEEINFIPHDIAPTDDRNFGWRPREGFVSTPTAGIGGPQPVDGVDPIIAYAHGGGAYQGFSVVGGIVYRGPITELRGMYIFADTQTGNIWGIHVDDIPLFDPANPALTLVNLTADFTPDQGSFTSIVSFAEDEAGNLLIVDMGSNRDEVGGHIFRVLPDPIIGDLDGDGFVGITDLNLVLGNWNLPVPGANPLADPSGDGFVGIEDLNLILGDWNAGTPSGVPADTPEPATLVLLGLTLPATLSPRRSPV